MLAAAQHNISGTGAVGGDPGGAGCTQPVGGALSHQPLHGEVIGVQPAAEPGDRNPQAVDHRGVELDP